MSKSLPELHSRNILVQIFGDTVQVRLFEILLNNTLEEQQKDEINWLNFSEIAYKANVGDSPVGKNLNIELRLRKVERDT